MRRGCFFSQADFVALVNCFLLAFEDRIQICVLSMIIIRSLSIVSGKSEFWDFLISFNPLTVGRQEKQLL